MGNDKRSGVQSKPAWFCRTCLGQDGHPARNLGHRLSCFKCFVLKGKCHLRNDTVPVPSRSVAGPRGGRSSQPAPWSAAKGPNLEVVVADLRAQLEAVKLQFSSQASPPLGGTTTPVAVEAEAEYEESLQSLLDQRAYLVKQGTLSESSLKFVTLDAQIKLQREARDAAKPSHIRIATCNDAVKKCEAAVVAAGIQRAKLCADVDSIRLLITKLDAQTVVFRTSLLDAESMRDDLLLSLHGSNTDSNAAGPVASLHLSQVSTALDNIPDDVWASLGSPFDRKYMAGAVRGIASSLAAEGRPTATKPGGHESVISSVRGDSPMDTAVPGGLGHGLAAGTGGEHARGQPVESACLDPLGPAAALAPSESRVPRPREGPGEDLTVCDMLAIWGPGGAEQTPLQMAELVQGHLAKRRCRPFSAGPLGNA
jgi:hypothetical protein